MEQTQAKQNENMLKNIENLLGNILAKQSRPQSRASSNFSAISNDRINVKSPILLPVRDSINLQNHDQNMENDVRKFVSQHIQDIVPDLVVHVEQDLTSDGIIRNVITDHDIDDLANLTASMAENNFVQEEFQRPQELPAFDINQTLDDELDEIDANNEIIQINRFLEQELENPASANVSEKQEINQFLQDNLSVPFNEGFVSISVAESISKEQNIAVSLGTLTISPVPSSVIESNPTSAISTAKPNILNNIIKPKPQNNSLNIEKVVPLPLPIVEIQPVEKTIQKSTTNLTVPKIENNKNKKKRNRSQKSKSNNVQKELETDNIGNKMFSLPKMIEKSNISQEAVKQNEHKVDKNEVENTAFLPSSSISSKSKVNTNDVQMNEIIDPAQTSLQNTIAGAPIIISAQIENQDYLKLSNEITVLAELPPETVEILSVVDSVQHLMQPILIENPQHLGTAYHQNLEIKHATPENVAVPVANSSKESIINTEQIIISNSDEIIISNKDEGLKITENFENENEVNDDKEDVASINNSDQNDDEPETPLTESSSLLENQTSISERNSNTDSESESLTEVLSAPDQNETNITAMEIEQKSDKNSQNLSDLVKDTQKIIKQMRDEINSDQFTSDDEDYSDYDESNSDDWTDDGEEEELVDEEEEGSWTGEEEEEENDDDELDNSVYYEDEEEDDAEPRTSISHEARSSQSIESEQFVEAQEDTELEHDEIESESHEFEAISPPLQFLDSLTSSINSGKIAVANNTEIVSQEPNPTILSVVELPVNEVKSKSPTPTSDTSYNPIQSSITVTELTVNEVKSESPTPTSDTSYNPIHPSITDLLENIANIQKSLNTTSDIVVGKSLKVKREDASPLPSDLSISPSTTSISSIEIDDASDRRSSSMQTQNESPSKLDITIEKSISPQLIENSSSSNVDVDTQLISDLSNTISINVSSTDNSSDELSELRHSPDIRIQKPVEPIVNAEINVSSEQENETTTMVPTTSSSVQTTSSTATENTKTLALPPPIVITGPSTTEEAPSTKKPLKQVNKKIPVRKTSLPGPVGGPFGSIRTNNVKAMQQELLNKTVPKQVVPIRNNLGKPSKIVPPKVYTNNAKGSGPISSLTERINKFIKPFTNQNEPKPVAVKREIPKKKYHETCFSDDYQTSEDEDPPPIVVATTSRQTPMRQMSMPNIMRAQFGLDEDEEPEVIFLLITRLYICIF